MDLLNFLNNYLKVTGAEIKEAVSKYLDTDNRVLLDIVPAPEEAPAAATLEAGEPAQPGAPAPQIPEPPPAEPEILVKQPATAASKTEPASPQAQSDGS